MLRGFLVCAIRITYVIAKEDRVKTFIVRVSVDAESEVRAKMILEHAIEVGAKEGHPDAEQDEVAVVLDHVDEIEE